MTLQNHQVLTYFPGTSGARASLLSAKVARAAYSYNAVAVCGSNECLEPYSRVMTSSRFINTLAMRV